MLTRRIIPCLDIKDGRVVKGIEFENLRDAGDAVELASRYDADGADELAFLDITASVEKRRTLLDLVSRVAERIFIPLTVGGGITRLDDVRNILRAGADKVTINTAAVSDPELLSRAALAFGSQCVVLAIDAKRNRDGGWEVFTHGGRTASGLDAIEWARRGTELGAGEILLTSMDADGTTSGYDLQLTRAVARAVGVPVIASGGAGHVDHLARVFTEGEADAAIVASILHYGQTSVTAMKQTLIKLGLPIRPLPDAADRGLDMDRD